MFVRSRGSEETATSGSSVGTGKTATDRALLFMDSSDCRNLSCNATVFPSNVDAAFTKAWDTSPLAAITSNRKNGQAEMGKVMMMMMKTTDSRVSTLPTASTTTPPLLWPPPAEDGEAAGWMKLKFYDFLQV